MTAFEYAPQERLLRALAEQLKMPLLHIARSAELGGRDSKEVLASITYTADMAMQLIDSYLLSTDLQAQPSLQLEPVSISSVLQDVAHRLTPLAKQYDYDLDISLSGKYGPVMAHRDSLEAAYMMLGYTMIESQPVSEQRQAVILGAHKSSTGIVAGVFGQQEGLTADMFRRARALYGRSRQPLSSLSSSAGAGIFVADSLLGAMSTSLKVAHHHKMAGFAATLLPSQQLQLI
jgi:hypothetical protein